MAEVLPSVYDRLQKMGVKPKGKKVPKMGRYPTTSKKPGARARISRRRLQEPAKMNSPIRGEVKKFKKGGKKTKYK
jgi:hypothetical protein